MRSAQDIAGGAAPTVYDALNRLTDMQVSKDGTLASFNYNPNETGRALTAAGIRRAARETIKVVESPSQSWVINRNVNYDYDHLNRLTREEIALGAANTRSGLAAGSVVYDQAAGYADLANGLGFDRVGNRHSLSLLGANAPLQARITPVTGQNYDVNDRLDTDGIPDNTNPNYDHNGNTLTGVAVPPQASPDDYDFENHLAIRHTTLDIDGTGNAEAATVRLVYDGDGNRVRKIVANGANTRTRTTDYLVDDRNATGYSQVIEEVEVVHKASNETVTTARRYIYGLDLVSQSSFNPSSYALTATSYYGYDGHGSVRFLMDPSAQVTDAYNYDAFGVLLDQWHKAATATPNDYLYSGERYDADLGNYYLRARYYTPQVGRFWTMDAVEGTQQDPLSLHKYLYCEGNPVNRFDPSGNESLIGVSIASTISVSLQTMYNGLISGIGNAMQFSIQGVIAGQSADAIMKDFVLDETGIQLGIDVFDVVKSWILDHGARSELASAAVFYQHFDSYPMPMLMGIETELDQINEVYSSPRCLVAGTLVDTEAGMREIETIKKGDRVWAWNGESEQRQLKTVLNTFINRRPELVVIEVGDVVVIATPEHPFYTQNKTWKQAGQLKDGDLLFDPANPEGRAIRHITRKSEEATVYNMEVEGLHNYFITSEGILTHNTVAGYNHFFQRAFRPVIGYGPRALKAARYLFAVVHTKLHQDLNQWLKNYKGMNLMPRKGMRGVDITSRYGFGTVEQAMREFYQTKYPHYQQLFEEEVKAIKAGLTHVP